MQALVQQILDGLSTVVDFFTYALDFALLPFQIIDFLLDYFSDIIRLLVFPVIFVPPPVAAVFIFMVIFGFGLFVCSMIVGLLL